MATILKEIHKRNRTIWDGNVSSDGEHDHDHEHEHEHHHESEYNSPGASPRKKGTSSPRKTSRSPMKSGFASPSRLSEKRTGSPSRVSEVADSHCHHHHDHIDEEAAEKAA